MRTPPVPTLGAWPGLLAVLLCAGLAACGPGVGGTGTGGSAADDAMAQFGAQPASVCSSELAALLQCPSPGAAAGANTGSTEVYLTDSTGSPQVSARIGGNRVELSAPCRHIQFSGEWALVAGQPGRFYGSASVDTVAQVATLAATPSDGGISMALLDAQGRSLMPTALLHRVDTPPVIACP